MELLMGKAAGDYTLPGAKPGKNRETGRGRR